MSPETTRELAEPAKRCGDLFLIGVATPSDITPSDMTNLVVISFTDMKLFPAALLGGVDYLRAVGAPFPTVMFYP